MYLLNRLHRKPPNVTELPNSKTRTPPKYDLTSDYWHVFTARLAFVICFEVNKRRKNLFNLVIRMVLF